MPPTEESAKRNERARAQKLRREAERAKIDAELKSANKTIEKLQAKLVLIWQRERLAYDSKAAELLRPGACSGPPVSTCTLVNLHVAGSRRPRGLAAHISARFRAQLRAVHVGVAGWQLACWCQQRWR